MFVIGGLTSLENLTYYIALTMVNVSYISPIIKTSSLLTILMASIFMKEKHTKYRIIGTIIIILGVFIILTQNNVL